MPPVNLQFDPAWIDNPEELALQRLLCSTSLIAYIRSVASWYIVEEVHCAIASYLEAVAQGDIDRLMIFAGPRTGKSTLSSVLFPSWWSGKFPTDKIMQIGYKTDLPKRFSRQVRSIVNSRQYQTIFPGVEITQHARAAGYWNFHDINEDYANLAHAGEYQAAGVTAGIAGSGFNLGNLDDPMALQVDTPIPTTKGFVSIGELKVGDEVFGPDGYPIKVIAKSEVWKDRPLYRLRTLDGARILCDGGHLWPYVSGNSIKLATARDISAWPKSTRPYFPRNEVNPEPRSYSIELSEKTGKVQCITVERPDGLFLCGRSRVITHNSEQDKDSKIAKDRVWEWWGPGFYTRRQPGRNAIVMTMTRWATDDLAGRLLDATKTGGDRWEVLNIPALLDRKSARRIYLIAKAYGQMPDLQELQEGESLAPRRIPTTELLRSKANMTTRDWMALYMGSPVIDEGAILKVDHWRLWPKETAPECSFIFQCYDTAFEEKESGDYSAMTTWGVFEYRGRDGRPSFNMILLGRWKKRVESPDLPKVVTAFCHGSDVFEDDDDKEEAIRLCRMEKQLTSNGAEAIKGYKPDLILIENKASGITLVKELRRRKKPPLPVKPWNPPTGTRGQLGKFARANLAALVLEEGSVWYMDREWAAETIDECGKCHFDGSDDSDDLPDTVTMAMIYVRQTYRVEKESDINEKQEADGELERDKREQRKFYGAR